MDMIRALNAAIRYMEDNLGGELDLEQAAKIACVNPDSFQRFFSYITGMSLGEYVRARRLSLAAMDLRAGEEAIVDLAVKYGYESAAAFSRAFFRQHGIRPSDSRRRGGAIQLYPPVSFQIQVKGAKKMNFRMVEMKETQLWGISRAYDAQEKECPEMIRHRLWAEEEENIPGQLCEGAWNQPGSTAYDGLWYGVWKNGRYMIARDAEKEGLEKIILPAGAYAAFQTEKGGLAWEEFPRLFELIFDCWLPTSGYRQKGDWIVEISHLWTDHEARKKNRYYEVWVPVEKRE